MRTPVKIFENNRHLTEEEERILQRALRVSRGEINTILELEKAIQKEEQANKEAEELARNGEPGRAAHHYTERVGKLYIVIEHLIKELESELTELDHLVRDLHRVDAVIWNRMGRLNEWSKHRKRAA